MVERVATGVDGLDERIEDGLPEGSVTLITGGPGAGKTTFCMQYVNEGLDSGEKCLYIATGQDPEKVKQDAGELGMDLEREGLTMARVSPSNDVAGNIKDKIMDQSFDRIVLDSLSVFEMHWGEKDRLRKYINKLMDHFEGIDATVLVTSERPEKQSGKLSRFGVAEFIVDAIIKLEGFALGDAAYRSMQVVKMRRTSIDGKILAVELDENGLSVKPEQKA